MTTTKITINGLLYDGIAPVACPATFSFNGSEAQLESGDMSHIYTWDELTVSPRIGRTDRFIQLKDGGQYHCADQPFLDKLPQEFRSEGLVAWLEKHQAVALASIVVVISTLLIGYFYIMPAFVESLVQRIPIKTEVSFGQDVLAWFDESEWFTPSEIGSEQRNALRTEFTTLHKNLTMSPYIQLKFRNSQAIGPNAFALPGGTIIITDQMLELAESNDEILAILAHEAGHVEKRHSMRQVLQGSLLALAIATVTADATTAGATLSGLPALVLQSKYSRKFETEADEFAFSLLQKNNISPDAFARIMERLDETEGNFHSLSFISTHPITSERIKKAREETKSVNDKH